MQTRDVCRGCYRTLDEISKWASYTRAEKIALLENLARRKARAPFPHSNDAALICFSKHLH